MKVNFRHHGNFNNLEQFLVKAVRIRPVVRRILEKYGEKGVQALREATPKDSGETAKSWSYEIVEGENQWSIVWKNSNIHNGYSVALMLQYGHGTGTGGYVEGIDFINPAIRGIFNQMAEDAWREVTS